MAASAILTYHSLDPSSSVISTHPEVFRQHMETLVARRIPVVPLTDIQRTPEAIALTFDDAYANFLEHALPVLAQHRFPATVFVVTGHCGGVNEWPHGPAARIPSLRLMGWTEVRALAEAGIAIGAHTVHHRNLASLAEPEAARELRDCRAKLEDRLGRAVEALAYPYGVFTPAVRGLARGMFRFACGILRQGGRHDPAPARHRGP